MKTVSILVSILATQFPQNTGALYQEDAGVFDFLVATAGHGPSTFVHSFEDGSIITSSLSSCIVASRSSTSGTLQWRRNVCSTSSTSSSKVIQASTEFVYTMDDVGVVRAWNTKGELVWDALVEENSTQGSPQLWIAGKHIVACSNTQDSLSVYNAKNGSVLSTLSAKQVLEKTSAKPQENTAMWLNVFQDNKALVGWTTESSNGNIATVSTSSMALATLKMQQDGSTVLVESVETFKASGTDMPLLVSSLKLLHAVDNEEMHLLAVSSDQTNLVDCSLSKASCKVMATASQLNPSWSTIQNVLSSQSGIVGIVGGNNNDSMSLFSLKPNGLEPIKGTSPKLEAFAYCPDMKIVVGLEREQGLSLQAYKVDNNGMNLSPVDVTGDSSLAISDPITSFDVTSCDTNSFSALISTKFGTTMQLTFTDNLSSNISWTTQEGLAQVSSALLLDASHSSLVVDALSSKEEQDALHKLDLTSRLQSQWVSVMGQAVRRSSSSRDRTFGFLKVALLLSNSCHRLWGMDSFGKHRGKVRWTLDLPSNADWHTMVHGTTSASTAVHGGHGATASKEVLVLSSSADAVEWSCLDGITGTVHSNGSVSQTPPVVQIVPLFASSLHGSISCRQIALVVHKDGTVSVVPNNDATRTIATEHLETFSSKNGLYSHVLKRDASASLESLQISEKMTTRVVGQTLFAGERIVGVAYPQRDEIVQSPTTVLGDDSLLLKYLNPHLAVVVTLAETTTASDNDFATAFDKMNTATGKRRPLGVTQPGESAPTTTETVDMPNLFVNIVDTVSGRVLHRASHANAAETDHIPVLVNENWIIYSFFNNKTRRTELGVLTLYEGMIDKNGLTAFSAPEQALSFSSLNVGESKPVVLGKTYGLSKMVTALGVTSTRGGISARHVLVATGDDKINAIDRRFLEPRRPTGEVKDHEKKEGLSRYSPLIPLISMTAPSYNQTVSNVQHIISSPTALESQSLVLAFGGPDLFFTRTSPSKGFDVLPDSFNRSLLGIIVIGLITVLFVVRSMSSKKMVTIGWT